MEALHRSRNIITQHYKNSSIAETKPPLAAPKPFNRGGSMGYRHCSGARSALYDVTDRLRPVKVSSNAPKVQAFAKNGDASRVAVIDFTTHILSIHSTDGIVAGAPALYVGTGYTSVTGDGENFYALRQGAIDVLGPRGPPSGYAILRTFALDPTFAPTRIHFGESYLVVSGSSPAWTWRVYRAADGSPVAIDITATTTAPEINAVDGVVTDGYLLLCAKSVGDVTKLVVTPAPIPGPPPTPKIIESTVSMALYPESQKAEAKAWYDYVKSKYNPTHIDMVPHPDGWLVYWF